MTQLTRGECSGNHSEQIFSAPAIGEAIIRPWNDWVVVNHRISDGPRKLSGLDVVDTPGSLAVQWRSPEIGQSMEMDIRQNQPAPG
jgi:hypothetical protein